MKDQQFKISWNERIARDIFRMKLLGSGVAMERAGQFVNVKIEGLFLRRPISICDCREDGLDLVYKIVGEGTERLSKMKAGENLNLLLPLGNGFDSSFAGSYPLLIGGGVGVAPLYYLAKRFLEEEGGRKKKKLRVILGFNSEEDVFFVEEFRVLGCEVGFTTVDGTYGKKGFVSELMDDSDYSYIYACGPEAMLKAVAKRAKTGAQFSFEARMACGFGACMGCTKKTRDSYKRICKEGPVFFKEEILW